MTRMRIDVFVLGEGRLRGTAGEWSGGRCEVMLHGSSIMVECQSKPRTFERA